MIIDYHVRSRPNSSVYLGNPGARHVAAAHKRTIEGLLAAAFAEGGTADPARSTRQSILLIEGAMTLRLIHGDDAYLDAAEAAALALVVPPARPSPSRRRVGGEAC